jgi:hypothetical protein
MLLITNFFMHDMMNTVYNTVCFAISDYWDIIKFYAFKKFITISYCSPLLKSFNTIF